MATMRDEEKQGEEEEGLKGVIYGTTSASGLSLFGQPLRLQLLRSHAPSLTGQRESSQSGWLPVRRGISRWPRIRENGSVERITSKKG